MTQCQLTYSPLTYLLLLLLLSRLQVLSELKAYMVEEWRSSSCSS
jgi:hypothetical protein